MIEIDKRYVETVRAANTPRDLHESLQAAIVLELATIPPYLTAYFSLKPGENDDVADLIRSVVAEEMLHLTIAANVLNAVGGCPTIDSRDTVLDYPAPLPMSTQGGPIVHIGPMSPSQTELFMKIERPEDPIAERVDTGVVTIGDFYAAIIDKIKELGEPAFATPSAPQVTAPWFGSGQLFAVTDVTSAARALRIVVEQGEGQLKGFSYTGTPSGVHPMITDPKPEFYPPDTKAGRQTNQFSSSFRHLLVALQKTFTGRPSALNAAMGIMYELRLQAIAMTTTPDPRPEHTNHCVTPCWTYGPLH